MIDLKTYGYTEIEIPSGLLPGRITELQRERFTVITAQGEVTAVLKGTFYHSAETREDFPCVGDFVLLLPNGSGDSLIVTLLPAAPSSRGRIIRVMPLAIPKLFWSRSWPPTLTMYLFCPP